jgi:uncharacterized phage infection (PIP) family protein YhgE
MSKEIALVGGIALIAAGGSIASLYYSYKVNKQQQELSSGIKQLQTGIKRLQPEVSSLQGDVQQIDTELPEINSRLGSLQGQYSSMQNELGGFISKVEPELNAISGINSTLSTMERDIASIPSDLQDAMANLQRVIPVMLAQFGADLKNIPVFKSLMSDEASIANQVNLSYLIVRALGGSIEKSLSKAASDIENGYNVDIKTLQSQFSKFSDALAVLRSGIQSLPSSLSSRVISELSPSLNSIENDVSPIISTINSKLSPVESSINSIKSGVQSLPSLIDSIGSFSFF